MTRLILCIMLMAGIATAAPVKTPSDKKKELRAEAEVAAELAVYYAANPDAANAATNWPAVWAAANNDTKKMKALGDRLAADDFEKKSKDKADKKAKKEK